MALPNLQEPLIQKAKKKGFEKCALVEEYVKGQEYSVEYISWKGNHHFLALTQKYTIGSPYFIGTGHLEPASVDDVTLERVEAVVSHALNSLNIQYGASHSELKISKEGNIKLIEIGGRMGGDNIGASLVELSTGYDFFDAVLDVALGIEPKSKNKAVQCSNQVRFFKEGLNGA
ncbi:MAG: ATP-grasp domain-containing protein [Lachnospiraceae bacterium]|nr:ATP-grasp domain-containing protein [Lachnospiraceae bacterium]